MKNNKNFVIYLYFLNIPPFTLLPPGYVRKYFFLKKC